MRGSDKIMFSIYREASYDRRYRVVYFTELGDHNRDWEINRALSGEHFYDGFIKEWRKEEAKAIIEKVVRRLNEGEQVDIRELERELAPYMPEDQVGT